MIKETAELYRRRYANHNAVLRAGFDDHIVRIAVEARGLARAEPWTRWLCMRAVRELRYARQCVRDNDWLSAMVMIGHAREALGRIKLIHHELGASEETRILRARQLREARSVKEGAMHDRQRSARRLATQLRDANSALSTKDVARRIAPDFGISVRNMERWLAASKESATR
jgi:hypothetical protein